MSYIDLSSIKKKKPGKTNTKNNIDKYQGKTNTKNKVDKYQGINTDEKKPANTESNNNINESFLNLLQKKAAASLNEPIDPLVSFAGGKDKGQNVHQSEENELTNEQRTKMIALLNLYVANFPEKLHKYKNKNFNNLNNSELIETKKQIQNEVTTSNNLNMICESSGKLLELYEFICCNYLDINIKGVSKLSDSNEYKECIKALLLKYLGDSLISNVEPEYKLCYLILSSSIMAHASNHLEDIKEVVSECQDQKDNNPPTYKQISTKDTETETNQIIQSIQARNINYKYNDL